MQYDLLDLLNWFLNGMLIIALGLILVIFIKYFRPFQEPFQDRRAVANGMDGSHNTGNQWKGKKLELHNHYGAGENLTKREKLLFAQLQEKDRQLERKDEEVETWKNEYLNMRNERDTIREELFKRCLDVLELKAS